MTGPGRPAWRSVGLLGVPVVVAFGVFAYNSGYGYDQLEYLVLGRAWARGVPFYTYIPSKSFGIFAFVGALWRLGVPFGHASLSAVIAGVFAALIASTYFVVRKTSDDRAAVLALALVAACAVFMEMNFLQPEAFVYLSALAAFPLLLAGARGQVSGAWDSEAGVASQRVSSSPRYGALALVGLLLSIGAAFKIVAVFYLAGCCLFVLAARQDDIRRAMTAVACLLAGFGVGFAIPAVFFALTGRFAPFVRWTLTFPLLDYPANTYYLPKLYTKLLGIHLVFVACIAWSLAPRVRTDVYRKPAAVAALILGLTAYLQVIKTQASHYCFPGAAFLSIFSAIVIAAAVRQARVTSWRVAAAGAALVLLVASGYVYRPEAFARLVTLRDFQSEEAPAATLLASRVPAGKRLVALSHTTWCYWLADRLPPPPFINTDLKTSWALRREPGVLLQLLANPDVVLVEYSPADPSTGGFDDPAFGSEPVDHLIVGSIRDRLESDFAPVPVRQGMTGFSFWTRREPVRLASSSLL